jgi:DNA-binding transcriptional LysR family regulator
MVVAASSFYRPHGSHLTTPASKTDRVLRRLKLRDLQMLLAVVEHGNMAKAAQRLSITRPVVSKTISDLERTVGMRLLDRSPQGVEPTVFGHALLKRCAAVFDELRQGVQELEFLAHRGTGEVRLGASEYMAAGFVPAVIDRLSARYPRLLFQLSLGDAQSLQVGELRERRIEFAIARLLAPQPEPDMQAEVLFYERVFIAAGVGNKWAKRRRIELAQLVKEPWILAPPEIAEGSPIVEAFQAMGLSIPEARVIGLSLPLRNGLLATGRFLTIVPGSVLRFGAERAVLEPLPVRLPNWRLPVAVITLKNRTLSPLAQLFLEAARQIARPLAKAGSDGAPRWRERATRRPARY